MVMTQSQASTIKGHAFSLEARRLKLYSESVCFGDGVLSLPN